MQVYERQFSGQIRGGGAIPVLVELWGELDADTRTEVDDLFARAASSATGDVRVEVSQLTFIGACGLGSLAGLAHRVGARGHRVHLVGAEPLLVKLLEITGLAECFVFDPGGDRSV